MIPVPEYLKAIAKNVKAKREWTSFTLACRCGCQTFMPYMNYFTAEEKKLLEPYYDSLHNALSGCWATTCTVDEDGTLHHWKMFTPAGLNGPKEEVFFAEEPFFAKVAVLKIVCQECGAEYLVFDSRCHGYDAVTGDRTEEEMRYQPHFKPKCTHEVGIEIKVENDPSLEAFQENSGLMFTEKQYSSAFSWVKVYAVKQDGKKRVILDCETA